MKQQHQQSTKNSKIDIELQVLSEQKFPSKFIQSEDIFIEYNQLSAIQKLQNISSLEYKQKFTYVKHLSIIFNQSGVESVQLLSKIFQDIIKQTDELKRQLLKQIPELVIFLQKTENAYQNLKKYIIRLLILYILQSPFDIKQQAAKHLGQVSHKLNDNDRAQFILKHVIQMAHDDKFQQNRIIAVQLFSKMAEDFGRQLCEQFIGLQILSLGEDSHLKVRKQAILNLPIISKQVSISFFKSRFFKFFQKKCNQNNWVIRKSCVEIIYQLTKFCDQNLINLLTEIYLNFLKDQNKWVKQSAFKNLGHYIYSLKGKLINQKLLEAFSKMASYQINQFQTDNQYFLACAYDFPAVIDAVYPERIQYLLQIYQKLLKLEDRKVKKTLASSLHQIAKIIGQNHTKNYLVNILDQFIKDNNHQIRLAAIQHLSQFIRALDHSKRQELIDMILLLQKDQKNWRIRQSIANQIKNLAQIYNPITVFTYIVPIAFKLSLDTVSIVRQQAGRRIGDIVIQFSKQSNGKIFLPAMIQKIKEIAYSNKYTQRQIFLLMCENLLTFENLFDQQFYNIFRLLANDKIINVRLSLCEILKKHLKQDGVLCENKNFIQLIDLLRNDPHQEIKQFLQ